MQATPAEVQQLYTQYGPVLFHRCRGIMGNDEDANDAVQETFARVIRCWGQFREDASPLTWMYRISTNHCLNQIRNRKGRQAKREVHRDAIVGEGFTRHDGDRVLQSDTVRKLMEDADEETRAIVTYIFFDDMTRAEAAAMVGISVPTLRKRLNLFLKRARRLADGPALPIVAGMILLAWVVMP